METLKVRRGQQFYLLYNLTDEIVRELQNDSEKLKTYFTSCLESGSNVCCIFENEENSELMYLSASSKATKQRKIKFSFLCGNICKTNCIFATKLANHPWHYFEKCDSVSSEHNSLPASMESLISRLEKVKSIDVNLNEDQAKNYYHNGKFIFKNKELKSHNSESKSLSNSTTRLTFVSGETNPLLFLNEFEKCRDAKTDNDKMYKITFFVDDCHKAEFIRLYFNSDWPTVRSTFPQMYSLSFSKNKKRELLINFHESFSLRAFVEHKLMCLAKFTTLPFINQIEMVMNDLPVEISNLFLTKEMMARKKSEAITLLLYYIEECLLRGNISTYDVL